MYRLSAFAPLSVIILLTACGTYTPVDVADPRAVTLNAALIDVADSLNDMSNRTRDRDKFGLLVDEVTVTFNINSKATNTGKLTVNAANIPVAAGLLGMTGENQLVAEGYRGNVVTVKLKNLATADTSKASGTANICSSRNPPVWCYPIAIQPGLGGKGS